MSPWIVARKTVQYLAFFIFIVLFIFSQKGVLSGDIINIPMRLDPLVMLAHLFASRTFLIGSSLALITVALTLVFGRAWCGWLCPMGTALDVFSMNRKTKNRVEPSEGWRKIKFLLVPAILVSAFMGNLTLLFLDPLGLLTRFLTVSIWPVVDRVVTSLEALLYQIPAFAEPVSTIDTWLRPLLLPPEMEFYRDTLLFSGIFLGIILLTLFAARFWCRYLCPLGGLLGLLSKLAIFRRKVGEECKGCSLCTGVCPTGTIDPLQNFRSDPGECTMCMECVGACPRGLNSFKPGLSLGEWQPYDPGRREALWTIGGAIAGVFLFRSSLLARRESPFLLRPPGAREKNPDAVSMTDCIRCSDCMRVCPTKVLQPASTEAGLEGFGTPVLIMRVGYCDYSCNACGQVCPVQAIPPLSLDQKRLQIVGKAYINESHCIAWSDHRPCIVCQEMCPLPKKAIQLEEAEVWGPDGTRVKLQLPHMIRELCIGCGICEYQCPASGEAAIQVYNPVGGTISNQL